MPGGKEAGHRRSLWTSGTDRPGEAAALILSDDNFSTIAAVEEGRNIFSNIRKFIRFARLQHGRGVDHGLKHYPRHAPALRPMQILWINLVTDGLPALALGLDRPDRSLMEQPPRPRQEGIFSVGLWSQVITRGLLIAVVTVALFAFSLAGGASLEKAQTMAFAALIAAQLIYVFECRAEGKPFWAGAGKPNWYLNGAVASSCLLMLLVIYHPLLRRCFIRQTFGGRLGADHGGRAVAQCSGRH